MKYTKHFSTRKTPQNEQIPLSSQVENSAGGYSWKVDDWTLLKRFLILGSEGGSYYVDEKKMTVESASAVIRCAKINGKKTVDMIVEISDNGKAPKNDPAIFAMAICAASENAYTRKYALQNLSKVCRIPTHLFKFLSDIKELRGWGRGLREAISKWYLDKNPDNLAYHIVKYRNREGWNHIDALRLSHPKAEGVHQEIFKYIKNGEMGNVPETIRAFEALQKAETNKEIIDILKSFPELSWEMIPTQFLKEKSVWTALIPNMKYTALIRNLARITANGTLVPMSELVQAIVKKLTDVDSIKKSREHPLSILMALNVYSNGRGEKGNLSWIPIPRILDALNKAFYIAFDNIEPTGKRILLALDVSSSMTWNNIAGMTGITPRVGSVALAMATARTEENYHIMGFSHELVRIPVTSACRLDDAIRTIERARAGGTDCALPMVWALENKVEVDTFVIYTDNETWFGKIHPAQALKEYRNKMGINSKLVVVSMLVNKFSIADPNDSGMMDIVGFDTACPAIISEFIRG